MKKIGTLIIRIAIGIVFIWGGLEKFIPGFFGGPGLEGATGFVGGLFGVTGIFATVLTIGLAITELTAGILVVVGKRLFEAYGVLAIILLVGIVMVWLPAGFADMSGANNVTWVTLVTHVGLFGTILGLALENKQS